MSLERCLGKLEEIDIGSEKADGLVRLKGIFFMSNVGTWGFLDARYESAKEAFIPTPGYFKRSYCCNTWKSRYFGETYESMLKILNEEGFSLVYYTDVKEI